MNLELNMPHNFVYKKGFSSPTRAVVETVDEVSPPTLVETERGEAPEK